MRVLHLLSSTSFAGAESMTLQLARAQRVAGVDARVALLDIGDGAAGALAARFEAASVPVEIFATRGRVDPALVKRLRARVGSDGIDLLHSHKYKCTLHALLAAAGLPVPLVATYHNWILIDAWLRLYAAIDKRLARFCAACVAVSEPVRLELERFVPSRRVFKINNGIDPTWWVSPSGESRPVGPESPWIVGFVGRLSIEKGADLLIDALAQLPEVAGRPMHALIVGDGPERAALEEHARRAGVAGRVKFAGATDDARRAYASMDVLALPSRVEGLPMTLLEAMSSQVPAVAMRVGEVPTVIRDGVNGWLSAGGSATDFATALQTALGDAAETKKAGLAARLSIIENYSAGTMAAAYQVIYGEALETAPRR